MTTPATPRKQRPKAAKPAAALLTYPAWIPLTKAGLPKQKLSPDKKLIVLAPRTAPQTSVPPHLSW